MDDKVKEIKPNQVHNEQIVNPPATTQVVKPDASKDLKKKEEKINLLNPKIPAVANSTPLPQTPPVNKGGRPTNASHAGRPSVMTPEVLRLLEEAFEYDMTDEEACLHAGIGKSSLYEYQKENPKFTERKQELKNNPVRLARMVVIDSLKKRKIKVITKEGNIAEIEKEGDTDVAMKYLERKKKDEFSQKMTVAHAGEINTGAKDVAEALQEILKKQNEDAKPDTKGSGQATGK